MQVRFSFSSKADLVSFDAQHSTNLVLLCDLLFLFYSLEDFDRHELLIYEEVAKVPPFRRKTLILMGAPGVGRRSLKNKLLVSDPQHYGTTIPCESSRGISGAILRFRRVQTRAICRVLKRSQNEAC